MRPRLVFKIVLSVTTAALIIAALVLAIDTDEGEIHHGLQAIGLAVLSLTTVTAYRYCED